MVKIILKKIAYAIIILILIFLSLEILQRCRRVCITKNTDWLYYGFKMPKNVIPLKKAEALLFREPFKVFDKDMGLNILFIGGSSTYGVYNDNLHTFPYLLEKKLDRVACLNAGEAALASDGYLGILKRCCEEFCIPDMVIFYTGYNDMFRKSFNPKDSGFFNSSFMRGLERYSFLLLSISEKIMICEQVKKRKDPEYRARFISEFKNNIEECIKFAKDRGIKVVIVPEVLAAERFSSSITNDYRWYKDIYEDIPRALERLGKEDGCDFLNPREELYTRWKANFIDPVHLTDNGNEILSLFLKRNLFK